MHVYGSCELSHDHVPLIISNDNDFKINAKQSIRDITPLLKERRPRWPYARRVAAKARTRRVRCLLNRVHLGFVNETHRQPAANLQGWIEVPRCLLLRCSLSNGRGI